MAYRSRRNYRRPRSNYYAEPYANTFAADLQKPIAEEPEDVFSADNFKRETVIEWDDLRETFLAAAEDNFMHPQAAFMKTVYGARDAFRAESFYGNTTGEMCGFLHNGFTSDELASAEAYVKEITLPNLIWDEEGENVDVAAALSGDDEPFFQWEDIPTKPGIKIVAELAFLAGTSPSTIGRYGAWLAGLIANLEGEGVDVELDIALPSERNLVNQDLNSRNQMVIRVKRAGEVRDFADYSALFSPGGFRILGFCARAMACQMWGVTCSTGFGSSYDRKRWGVCWDDSERTLYITRPAQPESFPADEMTARLAECGIE